MVASANAVLVEEGDLYRLTVIGYNADLRMLPSMVKEEESGEVEEYAIVLPCASFATMNPIKSVTPSTEETATALALMDEGSIPPDFVKRTDADERRTS